ncbi:hypothetical protein K474DRAFT_408318 [Panus rudis PR-1116 ss-1]|nr:hypothetical protein K474DRAFT_408318 [Panus rudis PR-1116 ss-1]
MASVGSTTIHDSASANESARRTLTALIVALQSPDSDYDLKQEIDNLGKFVGELSLKFVGVYMGLDNVIKSSDISSDLKEKLETVRNQWEHVMEILMNSIMLSGDIADVAVSTCKDFLGSVLPLLVDDSVSLDSKKYMISQFIDVRTYELASLSEFNRTTA